MKNEAIMWVLFGTLAIALYNVLQKKEFNRNSGWKKRVGLSTALLAGVAALTLIPLVFLTGGPQTTEGWWVPVLITGLLNIGFQYFFMKARTLEDMSLVIPIAATTPAFVIITAMIIVHEFPTRVGWLGILLMVVGTYTLNIQAFLDARRSKGGKVGAKDWLAPFLMFRKSRGIQYAFAAMAFAMVSINYDSLAARKANAAFAFAWVFLIIMIGNLLIAWLTGEMKRSAEPAPKITPYLIAIAILYGVGCVMSHYAFRFGMTAYVGTFKRLQIPTVIILSYFLLGEKLQFKQRLVGGITIATGAILIALG